MLNESLWIVLMLFSFIAILLAYRFFGKTGLYVWTALAVIIANIQVMKTVQLFGYVTALGNVIYGSTFLVTDILSENHGKKAARDAVFLGFFVLIAVTIIMAISLQFIPDSTDTLTPALEQIFGFLPRIAIASLSAYMISQLFDIWLFAAIKRITKQRFLWLRNNLSTMVSQLIDNVIFTWIAFVGLFGLYGWDQVFPWKVIISIFLTSYVIKAVVAMSDTPFVYLAKKFKQT